MTEFEIQALDRLTEAVGLLRGIAGALAALNVGARQDAGLVRNFRPHDVAGWEEREEQIFAAVVKGMIELGLTQSRLRTRQLIAAAADRPALRQAFAAMAAPAGGPADAIDPLRLGLWFSDREHKDQAVMGWRLMADRKDQRKPRWYLVRAEGNEGV